MAARPRWPLVGRDEEMALCEAALADQHCRGVVISGPSGAGTSRLAEELRARVATDPAAVTWWVTASTAATPLEAFADLLPADVAPSTLADPAGAFATVARALAGPAAPERRRLLFVEDLQLLDAAAALLCRQLVDAGIVRLVATLRADAPIGAAATGLVGDHLLWRVELTGLRVDQVGALLREVLGGPVRHDTVRALAAASAGLPIDLRELVDDALADGLLTRDGAVWGLAEGALPRTARLTAILDTQLAAVVGDDLALLEALALCRVLSLGHAEAIAGMAALLRLEESGLIRAVPDGRRVSVRLARPQVGQLLAARIRPERRRAVLLDEVGRLERFGARRVDDQRDLALWRLRANGQAEPELLLTAAAAAHAANDQQQAVELLRAVPERWHRPASWLALRTALREVGEGAEAETALRRADEQAADERERLAVTATKGLSLYWFDGRADAALAVIDAARDGLTSQETGRALEIREATVRVLSDDLPGGLRMLARHLPDGRPADPPASGRPDERGGHRWTGDDARRPVAVADVDGWLLGANARAIGLAAAGRSVEGTSWAEHVHELHTRVGARSGAWRWPAACLPARAVALAEAGRLTEARTVGRQAFDELTASRMWSQSELAALFLGRVELLAGHPVSARRWYGEAQAIARRRGAAVPLRLALDGLAAAAALLGDVTAADDASARAARYPAVGFWPGEERLGPAWALAYRNRLGQARAALLAGARLARDAGHLASEALLLTDVARLGGAGGVAERLSALAAQCEGTLVAARARLAAGLAADDPDFLLAAARELAGTGADLLAAEAASAAAAALRRAGEPRAATAAALRAREHAAACEGARFPRLAGMEPAGALSERERQVAELAASGRSARQVAQVLTLSVRTVENHLQRAYRKLGVRSRAELTRALGEVRNSRTEDRPAGGAGLGPPAAHVTR
ncbi:helix-turn-helix domain-containing protein [Frankia nepalensis]|uniref:AAA family ATPase n=1 Tax=Frankia nepalensis TaxID=1836974 RepID=A0A937RLE7_9ACTN|nr:helix-turn-helix transcriptional regulator [Frankia nepalensis]MBL7497661.1 AAA family ATPase [Frankia nepalensis]MBL7510024.1 AAA family ATPase [Frankia nepalensis]MBL7631045.1 AAA family ATPase [Frankia nepalensis]